MTETVYHTPGPWHCLETEKWRTWGGGSQPSSICHVGDYTIVTESPSYEFHGSDGDDARLIAAAPEMLEALKDAAQHFEDFQTDRKVVETVRTAIAKASAYTEV